MTNFVFSFFENNMENEIINKALLNVNSKYCQIIFDYVNELMIYS